MENRVADKDRSDINYFTPDLYESEKESRGLLTFIHVVL